MFNNYIWMILVMARIFITPALTYWYNSFQISFTNLYYHYCNVFMKVLYRSLSGCSMFGCLLASFSDTVTKAVNLCTEIQLSFLLLFWSLPDTGRSSSKACSFYIDRSVTLTDKFRRFSLRKDHQRYNLELCQFLCQKWFAQNLQTISYALFFSQRTYLWYQENFPLSCLNFRSMSKCIQRLASKK